MMIVKLKACLHLPWKLCSGQLVLCNYQRFGWNSSLYGKFIVISRFCFASLFVFLGGVFFVFFFQIKEHFKDLYFIYY